MSNKFVKVASTIGHDIKVAVTYLPEECLKLEHALAHGIQAEPDLKSGVITIVKAVQDAEPTFLLCAAKEGSDLVLDAAAVAKLKVLFDDFRTFLPVVEKVYKEVKEDFTTDTTTVQAETTDQQ